MPLIDAGVVATCAILDIEALQNAPNSAAVNRVITDRAGLRRLSMQDEVWDQVLGTQARLSHAGRRHAVDVVDLVVAAVASHHGATLLHYDRDFDAIAEITGQPTEWVVPSGSIP